MKNQSRTPCCAEPVREEHDATDRDFGSNSAQIEAMVAGGGGDDGPRTELDIAMDGIEAPKVGIPYLGEMKQAFEADFSGVAAHGGAAAQKAAAELGATAFVMGQHIVFGTSSPSKELVAHELAHTLQQPDGVGATVGGSAFEKEADDAATAVLAGETPVVRLRSSAGIMKSDWSTLTTTEFAPVTQDGEVVQHYPGGTKLKAKESNDGYDVTFWNKNKGYVQDEGQMSGEAFGKEKEGGEFHIDPADNDHDRGGLVNLDAEKKKNTVPSAAVDDKAAKTETKDEGGEVTPGEFKNSSKLPSAGGGSLPFAIPRWWTGGRVTAANLRIRAGADLNSPILGKLAMGEEVQILHTGPGWHEIRTNAGLVGWSSSAYIEVMQSAKEEENTGNPASSGLAERGLSSNQAVASYALRLHGLGFVNITKMDQFETLAAGRSVGAGTPNPLHASGLAGALSIAYDMMLYTIKLWEEQGCQGPKKKVTLGSMWRKQTGGANTHTRGAAMDLNMMGGEGMRNREISNRTDPRFSWRKADGARNEEGAGTFLEGAIHALKALSPGSYGIGLPFDPLFFPTHLEAKNGHRTKEKPLSLFTTKNDRGVGHSAEAYLQSAKLKQTIQECRDGAHGGRKTFQFFPDFRNHLHIAKQSGGR